MAAPSIPKIPVPVRGQQTGLGTNRFAALVKATHSLKPSAILKMTPPGLVTTLRGVNSSLESYVPASTSPARGSFLDTLNVEGTVNAREVLNALKARRTELLASIENTPAPGSREPNIEALITNQVEAKFYWDEAGSKVRMASQLLTKAFSFEAKTNVVGILADIARLNLAASHHSNTDGAVALVAQLGPLIEGVTKLLKPFKVSWTMPRAEQDAIEKIQAVRDQLHGTLTLLTQLKALNETPPPSFLTD